MQSASLAIALVALVAAIGLLMASIVPSSVLAAKSTYSTKNWSIDMKNLYKSCLSSSKSGSGKGNSQVADCYNQVVNEFGTYKNGNSGSNNLSSAQGKTSSHHYGGGLSPNLPYGGAFY